MDVWLDSGVAWHTLNKDFNFMNIHIKIPVADVIVEGIDQFRGWFQSSLLTSMAVTEKPPYKEILVHGFAVDDEGRKMSKSIGNVVHPETITDGCLNSSALGVDGLRLWVAMYASECTNDVRIGPNTIVKLEQKLSQIRNVLRFILGSQLKELEHLEIANYKELQILDRHCVRDRLYCEPLKSQKHKAARFTLHTIGRVLITLITPIMPHLAVEYYTHHPVYQQNPTKAVRAHFQEIQISSKFIGDELFLNNVMEIIFNIREQMFKLNNVRSKKFNLEKMSLNITGPVTQILQLRKIHDTLENNNSYNSQLLELLCVSEVNLYENVEQNNISVEIKRPTGVFCMRCRRMTNIIKKETVTNLCSRCEDSLSD